MARAREVEEQTLVEGSELPDSEASVAYPLEIPDVRRRGRPTKAASGNLSQLIVEIAFRQFLESGYAATSMDAVAAEARISKRTLYDRFPSKLHLFEATIQQRSVFDFESFRRFEMDTGPIESTLSTVAAWLVDHVLAQRNIALYRLISAEANRSPELTRYSEALVMRPVIDVLTTVFRKAIERGELIDRPPDFFANHFLQIVCGQCVREQLYGLPAPDESVMTQRSKDAIDLFINGAGSGRKRDDR